MMKKYISKNAKSTQEIAKRLAKTCKNGDIILLYGDLGAGKTVFAKGFVSYFSNDEVTSPTFTIENTYEGKIKIFHFDLYRIENVEELCMIGAEEDIFGNGISLVEWPERVGASFFRNAKSVRIKKLNDNEREIEIDD